MSANITDYTGATVNYTREKIRGVEYWVRYPQTSCKPYRVYQAIGAGNQDGPKNNLWFLSQLEARENLRRNEALARLDAQAKASASVPQVEQASAAVSAKAQRLSGGNRVVMLATFRAMVIGDHGTYDVQQFGGRWRCNCKWGLTCAHRGPCSHILAVQATTPESQSAVAPLAAMLNAGLAKMQADAQARLAQDEAELEALFKIA